MPENQMEFNALLDFLKRNRGFDFTGYKPASLVRRIQKRMRAINVESYRDYVDYLELHPDEFIDLFNTILINVTSFFRDPHAWDYIRDEIIPSILAAKAPHEPVRIWSTGCASGEEAYSIAMLLTEVLGEDTARERVKIYATDVDEEALVKARLALYTEKEVEPIPPELLNKYFTRLGTGYSFNNELRRIIIFGRNDLIQDAPISRVDLLICRNTLMYFNAETQGKILARFHFSLNDTGYLFLGKAEMLLTHNHIFTPVDLKLHVFSKVRKINARDRLLVMVNNGEGDGNRQLFNVAKVREASFETGLNAQVVVDLSNTLILANAKVRALFGLNPRDIGRPFQDLEISYRPVELRTAIEQSYASRLPVLMNELEWHPPSGEVLYFEVRVQPLLDSGNSLLGANIVFTDVTDHKLLQIKLEHANHELETSFEELQSTNEELETTNEELQSTIEELETTNEELQSTNEELETMNEELQSTNEELYTINEELHQRTEELNRVNAFMEAVLLSVQAGVVVLDRELRVQVWSRKAEDLWGLRQDEVEGQNFLNLDIGLPAEQLKRSLRACLSGETDRFETVLKAYNRRGREIDCRVSCTQLLGHKRDIQGLVVLMDEVEDK